MIEERNQLQLELSELQSERDRLFEEKVCVTVSTHPMSVQCSFCIQNCFQDVVGVVLYARSC